MPTDTKLQNLIINDLTEEQYKALTPNENELYLTPDTSSGESVSPTLNLFDFQSGTRTTITEQEKINLEKGLYNQINYLQDLSDISLFKATMPTKIFNYAGTYIFSVVDGLEQKGENNVICSSIHIYGLGIGEKNASGEYPIEIQEFMTIQLGGSGGSSEIPTLSTIAPSMSDLATTVYSDDDIALIKKQKDNFIKVPFGTAENNASELCYVSYGTKYSLIDIAGTILSFANSLASSPNFLYFDLDETTKKLTGKSYSSLSTSETSLYVESSTNKIFLTDQLTLSSPTQVLNKAYYFDKINGKSIIHEENTINNYDLGKSINLFGNHKVLVPNSSTDTAINLYNHDIEITFDYDQNQSSYHVYLNVVSSKNLNVNNITDLKALLGNTFTRSCTSGNDNSAQQEVIAISNNGFEFNNFSSILFSDVTQINIKDTVTTI